MWRKGCGHCFGGVEPYVLEGHLLSMEGLNGTNPLNLYREENVRSILT